MPPRRPARPPSLVFANSRGEILDFPDLYMAGDSCGRFAQPETDDLIELPPGSELFVLPGRLPAGINPATGEAEVLSSNPHDGSAPQAVAAFMAPAHTLVYTAAYRTTAGAPLLPLFAYAAVGWQAGKFWVAGFRSDPDPRQDADRFNQKTINRRTAAMMKRLPANRLVQHLGRCCLSYGCPAARNFFLGRWEAPLPTSPVCNASCAGCISLQPSGCCPAAQERISFVPSPREIAEIAVPHLTTAERAIVSFGQGCEGEPLLQAPTLEKSIRLMRGSTSRGTINLNSNAGLPAAVERLIDAGLDSIRVSLNSARPALHELYYRPRGFSLRDVRRSIILMKKAGRHVSLNYFILPGFTDDPDEYRALCGLIETCGPDYIQLRNLNMDPEWYMRVVHHRSSGKPLGIRNWLEGLRTRFPLLRFGYFNPPLR
ncbi:MAG TPA: radical SAM protein [Desulfobacteraceae bacterium]|nr:radical SAM protein [Desulfobacteraceae bacterium]